MATQKSNQSSRRIGFPYVLRHVISETMQYLRIAGIQEWMDLPMNVELRAAGSSESGEKQIERVEIYYAGGFKIVAEVLCGSGHYGGEYSIKKLSLRWKGGSAEDKIAKLQVWSGPCEVKRMTHEWDDDRSGSTLVLTGNALLALACNASWLRNELPTHKWDDVDHPRHGWQQQAG